jgi:hypothetical protein
LIRKTGLDWMGWAGRFLDRATHGSTSVYKPAKSESIELIVGWAVKVTGNRRMAILNAKTASTEYRAIFFQLNFPVFSQTLRINTLVSIRKMA